MPAFGVRVRPVRLRPPSMKYSIGKAARQHQVQVLMEHRGVKRLALEAAAQEEGAAAAQQRTDQRHVEIDAGGDVRGRQAVAMDQVGQQQVVDVTAVAGHINDALSRRDLRQCVEVMHLDVVVEVLEQPVQEQFQRTQGAVREIGCDLERELVGLAVGFADGNADPGRLLGNCQAHRVARQQRFDLRVAMGKIGADGHLPLAPEMHAEYARHLARRLRFAERRGPAMHQFAQRQRRIEADQRLAAVEQHRKRLAEHAGVAPGFGEQRLEYRFLLVRAAPPEYDHRHQLDIAGRIGHHGLHGARQQAGNRLRAVALMPVQKKYGTPRLGRAKEQRCIGRGQTRPA